MLGLSGLQDRGWVWGDGAGELGSKVVGTGKEDCQSKEVGFEFFFSGIGARTIEFGINGTASRDP